MATLLELVRFFYSQKKLWLLPLVLTLVIIGGALILAQGSVVAPFIYTIF